MTITDTQSYSLVIRDMLLAKLAVAPFFQGFTVRKSRILQVMPEHLPYLGAYIVDEQLMPDGDANAGHIRFINTLRIGFSVFVQNNDTEACEAKLDQAFWSIMNTLWRDEDLMGWGDTTPYLVGGGGVGNPDNTRIEAVTRGTRRHVYGSAGLNNETPIGELQYEASVTYRSEFGPIATDDLLEVHLTTGLQPGETEEEMAQRQQVGVTVVFTTEP